jgi:glycosyltransferase involved in cell wall biosynthesis
MKVGLFANTAWYLFNFRLALAKALRELNHEVVLLSPPGPYGRELEAEGFRWLQVPIDRGGTNPLREALGLFRLFQLVKQERLDVLHNFTLKSVIYGSLAGRLAGTTQILNSLVGLGYVFAHDGVRARALRIVVGALLKLACRGSGTRVMLQSDADRQDLLNRHLVQDAKIRVIPGGSGVDIERFRPAPADQRARPPIILFASRLLLDKGICEFVDAAEIVRSRGVACRFVVAGEPDLGSPRSVTSQQIDEWRRRGTVEFIGHQDNMPDLLAKSAAVVLPTAYGEGVPRILVETAACGTPIICSTHPGCHAVVEDGVNGYMLANVGARSIADAVVRLLADPEAVVRLGAGGRRKAVHELDGRAVLRQTLAVYREGIPNL